MQNQNQSYQNNLRCQCQFYKQKVVALQRQNDLLKKQIQQFKKQKKIYQEIQSHVKQQKQQKQLILIKDGKINITPNIKLPGFKQGYMPNKFNFNQFFAYSGQGSLISNQFLPKKGKYSFIIKPNNLSSYKNGGSVISVGIVHQQRINQLQNFDGNNVSYNIGMKTMNILGQEISFQQADKKIQDKNNGIQVLLDWQSNEAKIQWIFNSKKQAECKIPQQYKGSGKLYAQVILYFSGDTIQFI